MHQRQMARSLFVLLGTRAPRRKRRGLTLLELTIAMTIFLLGIAGLMQALTSSMRSSGRTREADRATQAAKAMLERIQAEAFPQAFRSFDREPSDDPSGAGTAPGASFAVEGLRAMPNDADGLPGEISFPTPSDQPGQLREDVTDADLGMPHDLNGDNAIDSANHATDYKLLPVRIRVRWQGTDGTECSTELRTLLANY